MLELVAERSDELVQLFCHQGVQTCQDVVGIWSHGGELVTELERIQGPLDAEEAFQVSALWTLAARRAHDHHRRVARAVIGNRVSVVETTSMVVAPQGTGPKGHVRQLLETGFPGRPPMLMAAATADPHTKAEAKRATKTQALFDLLLSEFLNLAELGVTWEELSDPYACSSSRTRLSSPPDALRRRGLEHSWRLCGAGSGMPLRRRFPLLSQLRSSWANSFAQWPRAVPPPHPLCFRH